MTIRCGVVLRGEAEVSIECVHDRYKGRREADLPTQTNDTSPLARTAQRVVVGLREGNVSASRKAFGIKDKDDAPPIPGGSFAHAKSLAGSHISARPAGIGRYAAAARVKAPVRCAERRRSAVLERA
jgi:hypothetical protein